LLIGLGVSSISDIWTAFAQNVKTVEEYNALIAARKLPLVKGHLLNETDTFIRQYILDMMCRGKVTMQHGFALNAAILERLSPHVADGLVVIDQEDVYTTEVVKSFLRNICLAFDERLHASRQGDNLFSQAI